MKSNYALLMALSIMGMLPSCEEKKAVVKVEYTQYHVREQQEDGTHILLWYYVTPDSDGEGYYFYASPNQVTNLSNVELIPYPHNPVEEPNVEILSTDTITEASN